MRKIGVHLGCGDAIAMAGLIVKLAGDDHLEVPCWQHNEVTVKSIFINHPNIHVVPVESEAGFNDRDIRLGYFNQEMPPYSDEDHITWMYRQAGVPFHEHMLDRTIQKAVERIPQYKVPPVDHFKFIHDDASRGYAITKVYDDPSMFNNIYSKDSILSYAKWLREAEAIHVIDSSFLHLADLVYTTGELFWHRYARPYTHLSDYKFRKSWKIID